MEFGLSGQENMQKSFARLAHLADPAQDKVLHGYDVDAVSSVGLAAGALAVAIRFDTDYGSERHIRTSELGDPAFERLVARSLDSLGQDSLAPRSGENALYSLRDYVLAHDQLFDAHGQHSGHLLLFFPAGASQDWTGAMARSLALTVTRDRQMFEALSQAELDLLSETRRADRFRRQSEQDQLTRLDNRISFRNKVESALDDPDHDYALIAIDIDDFKALNDLYGHSFGDQHLKQVARTIEQCFPRAVARGRLGGDEFAVLVPLAPSGQMDETRLRKLAEMEMVRLSHDVQRADARHGNRNLGHISQGAALAPLQGSRFERLFDMADAALYSAKASSSTTPRVFQASEHDSYSFRLLQSRFLKALDRNEIVPHFQPLVNLSTGRVYGFEALARWQDPSRGLLSPARFTGVLHDHGLAPRLTASICTQALDVLGRRQQAGRPRDHDDHGPEVISINLTAFEVLDQEFVFDLQALLTSFGLDWCNIILEVTENIMLSASDESSIRTLLEMRSRGARVALDDFGTGYGTLSHLVDMPVDIIKIDRSFVMPLVPGQPGAKIVEGIVSMAHSLGYKVVAEGVERPEVHDFLVSIGCDYGQGYLYSRPLAQDRLPEPGARLMPCA